MFHSNCVQLNPINDLQHIAIDVTSENCSKWLCDALSPAPAPICICIVWFPYINMYNRFQLNAATTCCQYKMKHNYYIVVGIAFGL